MKFKVGDHVIGNKKSFYGITKEGWQGVVTKVIDNKIIEVCADPSKPLANATFEVRVECFDLVKHPGGSKIVVTTDGTTTTARLYEGKSVIKSAEAKCSADDEFDFKTGAALAVDRLLDREVKAEKPALKLFLLGDIKAGYLLKVRRLNEEFFMTVLPNDAGDLGCCNNSHDWWPLARFGAELNYLGSRIDAVYGCTHNKGLLANSPADRKLLWSRD